MCVCLNRLVCGCGVSVALGLPPFGAAVGWMYPKVCASMLLTRYPIWVSTATVWFRLRVLTLLLDLWLVPRDPPCISS